MGRLNKELCRLLDITKLRSTAYHSQTNGILERWHPCLKGMLHKASNSKEEWDNLLKYCLLAYRATPHAATGFSPYDPDPRSCLEGTFTSDERGMGRWTAELQKLSGMGIRAEGHFSSDSPGSP